MASAVESTQMDRHASRSFQPHTMPRERSEFTVEDLLWLDVAPHGDGL